jgi:hypothetical protein
MPNVLAARVIQAMLAHRRLHLRIPTSNVLGLICLLFCLLATGCEQKPVWSTQVTSPDGKWVASARTTATGGFGTGDIMTSVFLTWTSGSKSSFEIMKFDKSNPDLTITWASPSHLDITYNGNAEIWLQVVRYGKVDITLHNQSKGIAPSER